MTYTKLFMPRQDWPAPVHVDVDPAIEEAYAETPKMGPSPGEYETITQIGHLDEFINEAFATGMLAVDTETTSLQPMIAELVGISLCATPRRVAYIPIGHKSGNQLPGSAVRARLKPLLEDPRVLKIMHNAKFDWFIFRRWGVNVRTIDDTMLMSYVLDASPLSRHKLDVLSERHLGHKTITFKKVTKFGPKYLPDFAHVAIDRATEYAAEDADMTMRLWELLKPRLAASGLSHVYEALELPMIEVLARMEERGILVDCAVLAGLSAEFATRIAAFRTEIDTLAGETLNPGSPKQLGNILFDKLGLPSSKMTDKGNRSTDAKVLKKLSGHELPAKITGWRELSKLKSTYTDALQKAAVNGRVHTSFNLAGPVTGRLSSSDQNLQNIPIRSDDGQRVRRAFVAPAGHKIVVADYSQIELRVLDQVADIPEMRKAFENGDDIHASTAAGMFKIALEEVPKALRNRAKAINFGIIYGMQAAGLAAQIGVTKKEAEKLLRQYHEQYPGILPYMQSVIKFARSNGYVETISGRRCYYPDIKAYDNWKRSYAERQAVNMTIQGSAADIIRVAMPQIEPALALGGLSAKMLLQAHDELVFEVPDDEVAATIEVVKRVMTEAPARLVKFKVPLVVAAEASQNWADAH